MLINRFRRVLLEKIVTSYHFILSANWLKMEHVNHGENEFISKKSPRRFPKSSRRLKIKKKVPINPSHEAGVQRKLCSHHCYPNIVDISSALFKDMLKLDIKRAQEMSTIFGLQVVTIISFNPSVTKSFSIFCK